MNVGEFDAEERQHLIKSALVQYLESRVYDDLSKLSAKEDGLEAALELSRDEPQTDGGESVDDPDSAANVALPRRRSG